MVLWMLAYIIIGQVAVPIGLSLLGLDRDELSARGHALLHLGECGAKLPVSLLPGCRRLPQTALRHTLPSQGLCIAPTLASSAASLSCIRAARSVMRHASTLKLPLACPDLLTPSLTCPHPLKSRSPLPGLDLSQLGVTLGILWGCLKQYRPRKRGFFPIK